MYSKKQLELCEKICLLLNERGYQFHVDDSSCRLDICLEVGKIKQNQFTNAIIAIFWASDGISNYIQYLGAGLGYSDGYEIKRGWTKNLTPEEAIQCYEEDIERVEKLHKMYN